MNEAASFGPDEFQRSANVSRETLQRLCAYADLLQSWQGELNLIAQSTLTDLWHRHMLDSAQLVDLAPAAARRWLDLGSGAGFPGLVIAILRSSETGFEMHLTERLAKKCAFLSAAAQATAAPAIVHHERIERLSTLGAEVITARACAPLPRLLDHYERHRAPGGIALFAKGRNALEELTHAEGAWRLDLDVLPSRTSSDGRILRIRSAERRR
jgi:16S rRNA (guanine527-N7)-methyltransferase